ncbi:lactaldehyde dehydrogenase [Methanocaldococcus infernus]
MDIYNPYTLKKIGEIREFSREEVREAVDKAYENKEKIKNLSVSKRYNILLRIANEIKKRKEEFAKLLAIDAGKPIRQARVEADRAIKTFRLSAFYTKELRGEVLEDDEKLIIAKREPIGLIGAITPYNFPLNLSAHKIGPALAVGNVVLHHPSPKAPLVCVELAKIIEESLKKYEVEGYYLLTGYGDVVGDELVVNDKVNMISFTGSTKVGEQIIKKAGFKKVTLELGGVNPNFVLSDADIDRAVERLVKGSFLYAGQVCISVGVIYVDESIYDKFIKKFVERVKELKVGDPLKEETDVGPVISLEHANWVKELINKALEEGGNILVGGKVEKTLVYPTVIEVDKDNILCKTETFAPVVPVVKLSEEEMLELNFEFGLHSGVFTRDINKALSFAQKLEFGGVVINDSSLYRNDSMPFGGVKKSGLGREGVRYSIEEMSYIKSIVISK